MTRVARFATAALLVIGVVVAVALTTGGDESRVATVTPQQATPTGCSVPATSTVAVPTGAVARDARVSVPGSTEIETHGFIVGSVVGDGVAIVTDPRRSTIEGMVGTIHGDALDSVSHVVSGCSVAALAPTETGAWAATCNPRAAPDATSSAELVLVDAQAPTRRIPLPIACAGQLALGGDVAWVTDVALAQGTPHLLRVDLETGVTSEPVSLGAAAVTGLVATPDSVWTSRDDAAGTTLVRNAVADGTELTSLPVSSESIVGATDGRLWTIDHEARALVARDLGTGASISTTKVPDLHAAAAAGSGTWFTRAGVDSLRVSVGTLEDTAAVERVAFTGIGPDRTGLPVLPTLSTTGRGAWLGYQNRLFLLPR